MAVVNRYTNKLCIFPGFVVYASNSSPSGGRTTNDGEAEEWIIHHTLLLCVCALQFSATHLILWFIELQGRVINIKIWHSFKMQNISIPFARCYRKRTYCKFIIKHIHYMMTEGYELFKLKLTYWNDIFPGNHKNSFTHFMSLQQMKITFNCEIVLWMIFFTFHFVTCCTRRLQTLCCQFI